MMLSTHVWLTEQSDGRVHVPKCNVLRLVKVFSATGLELHLIKAWLSSSSTVISTLVKAPFVYD